MSKSIRIWSKTKELLDGDNGLSINLKRLGKIPHASMSEAVDYIANLVARSLNRQYDVGIPLEEED